MKITYKRYAQLNLGHEANIKETRKSLRISN